MKEFRKAVFIGINYPDSRSPLLNCVNDARNMLSLIQKRNSLQEYILLTDEDRYSKTLPTRQNILKAFDWLFVDVAEGDNLFIHYSGHGGTVRDPKRIERDGKNETLCPCDYEKSGEIIDDVLNVALVKRAVEGGVNLFVVTDSCHSGSNCDERFSLKEVTAPQQQVVAPPQYQQQLVPQPQYQQHQLVGGFVAPPQPQYVIYQGVHYPYKVFYKRFIEPIDKAVAVLRQRNEYKMREAMMPEYHRSRSRDRDRGLVDWFRKEIDNLYQMMKTNPYIAHLLKTGVPIYPTPEFVGMAAAAVSIIAPPLAPFASAAVPIINSAISALSQNRSRATVKWTSEEDTKMTKYTGKGAFLKLSGCKDEQTSADGFNSRENGALTGCILDFFEKNTSDVSIGDFLFDIRSNLARNRFEQIPQLGSNSPISSDDPLPF
jgi:hypothetical protein